MAPKNNKNKELAPRNFQPDAMTKEIQRQAVDMAIATTAAAQVAKKGADAADRMAASAESLYNAAKKNQSRVHVGFKDLGGAITSVLSFEALNYLVRKIGDWSPAVAENIDVYQSLPQLIIGIIVYFGELLTRKKDATGAKIFPSLGREFTSEWAKAFAVLGANNLWRALSVRRKDKAKQLAALTAANLELEALKAELAALKKEKGK